MGFQPFNTQCDRKMSPFLLLLSEQWNVDWPDSTLTVEVQLFRKFISKQQVSCAEWPDVELTHALKPVIANLEVTKDTTHCGGFTSFLLLNEQQF